MLASSSARVVSAPVAVQRRANVCSAAVAAPPPAGKMAQSTSAFVSGVPVSMAVVPARREKAARSAVRVQAAAASETGGSFLGVSHVTLKKVRHARRGLSCGTAR